MPCFLVTYQMPSQVAPRSQLYALLVGIDNYPPPVTPLKGCLNDLQHIADYLSRETSDFDLHLRKIVDREATKANLVAAMKSHFASAKEQDVIFLYYSGHGALEEADEVFFKGAQEGKMETLVCYDGYTAADGKPVFRLLADKELRFLLSELSQTGAHIVTIFDCCHSGGNTRNGFFAKEGEVLERRQICRDAPSQAFPKRDWTDFIFADKVSRDHVKNQSLDTILPEGRYIHFAACQHDESAFEVGGEGMFTKRLLEVLTRCGGSLSYFDLQARIQNYLRYQFKQTPRAFASGDGNPLFLGFLNRKGASKPEYGNVNLNSTDGWVIDLGTMQGLAAGSQLIILDDKFNKVGAGKILEAYANYAQLEPSDGTQLDPACSYKGFSTDYYFTTLQVHLSIVDEAILLDLQQALTLDKSARLIEVKEAGQADYCIVEKSRKILLTRPEKPDTPIVPVMDYTIGQTGVVVRNHLNHISQFEFVKKLQNPNAFMFARFPIEVSVFQKGAKLVEEPIHIVRDELFPYYAGDSEGEGGSIRIKIKNVSDRKLFCSLLYLTFNFEVHVKLLKEVVVGLSRNEESWALDGAAIALNLEEEVASYNYPESKSTLKVIVSTSDFTQQALRFEMPALPGPLDPGQKGLEISKNRFTPEVQDWITRNIDVTIKNPHYRS